MNTVLLKPDDSLRTAIKLQESNKHQLDVKGFSIILDKSKKVIGCLSDGDIRRSLISGHNLETKVKEVMNSKPICFDEGLSPSNILKMLTDELKKRKRFHATFLQHIIITKKGNRLKEVVLYHEMVKKFKDNEKTICVIGLGYVGLTLAVTLAECEFTVFGVDSNKNVISQLNKNKTHIFEDGIERIIKKHRKVNLSFDTQIPKNCRNYIITVGTPLETKNNKPNIQYLLTSLNNLVKVLESGDNVILRSTLPIGTTENLVKSLIENKTKLVVGENIFLSFAPERTVEGMALTELRTLPQIIGSINDKSYDRACKIFNKFSSSIVRVNSPTEAELVKLINNSYRDYCFAFSNNLVQQTFDLNLNINRVIDAANNGYPRNKIPKPSPGVGGPCLTKDPIILGSSLNSDWKLPNLFNITRKVNIEMIQFFSNLIKKAAQVNDYTDFAKTKILICGLAFKGEPPTGDLRNSTGIEIYNYLKRIGFNIWGHDYVASNTALKENKIRTAPINQNINRYHGLIILNNHKKYQEINLSTFLYSKSNKRKFIVDPWGILEYKSSQFRGLLKYYQYNI